MQQFIILFFLGLFINSVSVAQNTDKSVKHVLWINVPDLYYRAIEQAKCPNIKYTANKGLSNFKLVNENSKDPYSSLLFSCEGLNIMQLLESENPELKTAAFSSDSKLIKKLKGVDHLKKGKDDVELTELAYDYMREAKPNLLFINFSAPGKAYKSSSSIDSESYKFALEEFDIMLSGLIKGLIESMMFNSLAIVISSESTSKSDNNNGMLLIQADGIVNASTIIDNKVSSEAVMPTILDLIGVQPQSKCSAKSILNKR